MAIISRNRSRRADFIPSERSPRAIREGLLPAGALQLGTGLTTRACPRMAGRLQLAPQLLPKEWACCWGQGQMAQRYAGGGEGADCRARCSRRVTAWLFLGPLPEAAQRQSKTQGLPLGGGGRVAVMGPDKRAGQSLLLVSVPGGGDCRGPGWRSSPNSVETVLAGEEWLTCCDDERPPTVLRRPDM
ncbi:hypothetical protein R6Z07M_003647 [Ovis aries]